MFKQKDILYILIPTFIVTILWIVFSIYHNSVTSTISETVNMQIVSVDPKFDLAIIEKLKERKKTETIYELEVIPTRAESTRSATPSPTPSRTTTATLSATPTAAQPSPTITP